MSDRTPTTVTDNADALLTGIAILEAHMNEDHEAMQALIGTTDTAAALYSVLVASEAMLEAYETHSPSPEINTRSIFDSFRRWVLRFQATV